MTIWEKHSDRIFYNKPKGHTFSLHLKGGTGTRRLDAGGMKGFPGAICVLPEGQTSDWEITTPFQFLHLVLPDEPLRAWFSRIHDLDARYFDLAEIKFDAAPPMTEQLKQLVFAAASNDLLLADSAIAELIYCLPDRRRPLQGGLATKQLRQTDAWIDANIGGAIRLSELAAEVGLSEFHFHRMFSVSRGTSPHKWVTMRKIEAAKDSLRCESSIAKAASACGFSCQSHLTRTFKAQTGMTPAVYRQLLSGV
ncbi:helix-turn-helix domain-containing protein [uncultured Roseobacter sp.]|uniref:helix-turn-helix transcriptional regulator n=1 Tax=uncultured Roseobacter sp. TaxID=114847 RepID=UPI00261CCB6B|nr:helix-turn-helix domain-containing protein [uncultured Roseobacter sp.]